MASGPTADRPVLGGRWAYDPHDLLGGAKGNAHTYGGKDLVTGEDIVVKIFRDTVGEKGRKRFRREVDLHRELKHPAILKLLDDGTEDGRDYIVTRRLSPGCLPDALMERGGPFPPAEVRAIGLRIADALVYLRDRRQVHGDISPNNVLLDAEGRAFLADFGLSKQIGSVPRASSGDKIGTEGYKAPRREGTPRTHEDDVFSLAAVLWWCLVAQAPDRDRRKRRGMLPNRKLRGPLEPALRWEDEEVPSAKQFRVELKRGWQGVGPDWRVAPSRQLRFRGYPALGLAVVALALAVLAGEMFGPGSADGAKTTVSGGGITLRLPGEWRRRNPPGLPALRFRSPIAVASGRTTVVAGRAPAAGSALISSRARRNLPRAARRAQPVRLEGREALSYGPANQFGGAVQILAMPLGREVLVVRCGGPAQSLQRVCLRAAVGLDVDRGSFRTLAPDPGTARLIRAAVRELGRTREGGGSRLADATTPEEASRVARTLAAANLDFADRLSALPKTAQDRRALGAAVRSAREAAAGYRRLATADTAAAWTSARAAVVRSEKRLEERIAAVIRLRTYSTASGEKL